MSGKQQEDKRKEWFNAIEKGAFPAWTFACANHAAGRCEYVLIYKE